MTQLEPGMESAAQACAFAIFGSDIPPIDPEDYRGSWRTTFHVIAEEWVGEGRVERHAARTAVAVNALMAVQQRHGLTSAEADAAGATLKPLIERCRQFGITTDDLRRHGAQLTES
ncbi:hypothetical protein [Streptomyces coeruleorubidus]|uniref:Uncharacterized protein n=1 Tax=Streptomyces coeruleorubidus TaxID=116188 RepID=A0ABZ0KS00_STRC4|nr:hypothetical protein [Streptomyces coeruleorubidus]WOT40661.1 hypothetical protein R5U08_41970 [Streptomyces coeruleorubidus]